MKPSSRWRWRGCIPRRLLVSTVGDELKIARAASKVIGISLKDRSAILPRVTWLTAHYWFDVHSGNFVSAPSIFRTCRAG